jgi:hypothetical protein
MTPSSKLPFIYVSSAPFSGSTLFSLLAGTHPRICTVGEMTGPIQRQDPGRYICSCGKLIRNCKFWADVTSRMVSEGMAFDPGSFETRIRIGHPHIGERLLTGSLGYSVLEDVRDRLVKLVPRLRNTLNASIDRNVKLAKVITELTGKTSFLDASKNHMRIHYLRMHPDLDFRVVHLVRDVRGASLSRRKNQQLGNWGKAVKLWRRANRNIERQLRRIPEDQRLRIRYEDLCGDPIRTLNLFYSFCGLPPSAPPDDLGAVTHHLIGNRMRLQIGGKPRLDEEWRRVLTAGELSIADRLAGSLHVRLGYPPMTPTDLAHHLHSEPSHDHRLP